MSPDEDGAAAGEPFLLDSLTVNTTAAAVSASNQKQLFISCANLWCALNTESEDFGS